MTYLPPEKVSLIFFFFYRNKLQAKKIWRIFENLRKTFFYRKKIQLQVQNRGYFRPEKVSLIFMKIYRNEV